MSIDRLAKKDTLTNERVSDMLTLFALTRSSYGIICVNIGMRVGNFDRFFRRHKGDALEPPIIGPLDIVLKAITKWRTKPESTL